MLVEIGDEKNTEIVENDDSTGKMTAVLENGTFDYVPHYINIEDQNDQSCTEQLLEVPVLNIIQMNPHISNLSLDDQLMRSVGVFNMTTGFFQRNFNEK